MKTATACILLSVLLLVFWHLLADQTSAIASGGENQSGQRVEQHSINGSIGIEPRYDLGDSVGTISGDFSSFRKEKETLSSLGSLEDSCDPGHMWLDVDGSLDGYPGVHDMLIYENRLIVGGRFDEAGTLSVNNVAVWNDSTWASLGAGIGGYSIDCMAIYNGELIVAGDFDYAGGISANNIAAWNGTDWETLGLGLEGGLVHSEVGALCVYQGRLIAGGDFTVAGGEPANFVAAWNGYEWEPVVDSAGHSINARVYALDTYGGKLIAGGDFTEVGWDDVRHIAAWDGNDLSWSQIGSGFGFRVLGIGEHDGLLIAGGNSNYVWQWNGASWSTLGSSLGGLTEPYHHWDGDLVVGGHFGADSLRNIAQLHNGQWKPLGTGMDFTVQDILTFNDRLYAAGYFSTASGNSAKYIAIWNGPYVLANISFRPDDEAWQICNCQGACTHCAGAMWPSSPALFPDWPLFVEAFGDDQCYLIKSPWYDVPRRSARRIWSKIARPYGGSCYGFPVSSLLFYDGVLEFDDYFNPGQFPRLRDVTTSLGRDLINKYWVYQFGKAQQNRLRWGYKQTDNAMATLQAIKDMLNSGTSDHEALQIFNNHDNSVRGAHTVVPYACEVDREDPNKEYVWVYDCNLPLNECKRIVFDKQASTWSYDELPYEWGGGGSGRIFLLDPSSSYQDTPVLFGGWRANVAMRGKTDSDSTFVNLFLPPADTTILVSGQGQLGNVGDSIVDSMPNGVPIIPVTGKNTEAIGYSLPDSAWQLTVSGLIDSLFELTVVADSALCTYSYVGNNGGVSDVQQLRYEPEEHSLIVQNPAAQARHFTYECITALADSETVVSAQQLSLESGDSIRYSPLPKSELRIDNFGGECPVRLEVVFVTLYGEATFETGSFQLQDQSSYWIVPDWRQFGDSLLVLVDYGMTGVFEDSVFLASLLSYCGDANGDGVANITDAVYLIQYIFADGPPPEPLESGDVNLDELVNVTDAVYLIQYIFSGGPPPCEIQDGASRESQM